MQADVSHTPLMIDYTNKDEILRFFPHGSLLSSDRVAYLSDSSLLQSTDQLAWSDLHFGYYRYPPFEMPESSSKQHLVIIYMDVPTDMWLEEITNGHLHLSQPKNGDIQVIPACVWQSFRWNRSNSYIMLSLDPDAFARRTHEFTESESIELELCSVQSDPLIYGIGLALKSELESIQFGDRLYLDSLNTTLFAHLIRHYSVQKPPTQTYSEGLSKIQLRQVIGYINSHIDQNLTLVELAQVVHLSPNYFSSRFKKSIGLTPHQYVIQTRVARARQLLINGKLTIAEIAHSLGFAHQSHLNFHFRRIVGVTPKRLLQEQ